jgi:hypothetical protein
MGRDDATREDVSIEPPSREPGSTGMNSYLNRHLNHDRRNELITEAATNRLASGPDLAQPARSRGIRAAIRRILSAPEATPVGFMPRLVDYPTAQH